jgi:16S rRNA (guanine966-N2)-methyltransferase
MLARRKERRRMSHKGPRIIAGERRGWKLDAPKSAQLTRPITDRVKENLFNIIQGLVPGAVVLDLFAGTGSLGLEALSREARWATFVEQHRDVAAILRQNVARLGYAAASRVLTADALHLRAGVRDTGLRAAPDGLVFGLVFVDPPYRMTADPGERARVGQGLARLVELGAVAPGATIVLRRESRTVADCDWPGFLLARSRVYGSMALDFLSPAH